MSAHEIGLIFFGWGAAVAVTSVFSGAAVAPWPAGVQISVHLPFWVGAGAVLLAAATLVATRKHLSHIDDAETELDELTAEATAITVGSDS